MAGYDVPLSLMTKAKKPMNRAYGTPMMPAQNYMQPNPWGQLQQPTQQNIGEAVDEQTPLNFGMVPRPPVGSRPGEGGESKLSKEHEEKYGGSSNQYDPEVINNLISTIEGSKPIQEQRQGLDAFKALNEKVIQNIPTGVDLSPLMALSDAWTGSKLAAGYKPPPGYQDKAALLLKYGDEMQKRQQDVSKDILSNAYKFKTGMENYQLQDKLNQMIGLTQKNMQPPIQAIAGKQQWASGQVQALQNKYEADVRPISQLQAALSTGDSDSIKRQGSNLMRTVGGDGLRVPIVDIAKAIPGTSGMTLDEALRYAFNEPSFKLTPEMINSIQKDLDNAANLTQQRHLHAIDTFANSIHASPQLASMVDADAMIAPVKAHIMAGVPKVTPAANSAPGVPSASDFIQEYLKAKNGGK